ncbi:MAG: MBOAT family protein, partial [Oscillospiraceae bacterium]|nr:MBOAT family protein [Oscillospiraceae bacterium]
LSLFFYAWGEPVWVVLLLFSATLDFFCGQAIGRARQNGSPRLAKIGLVVSITVNLSLLAVFKYLDFFLENAGLLFHFVPSLPGIALPIGISFYTFQTMSYTIDVYKNQVGVQKSYPDFLLFVSLFPQLIAGPILRYSELEHQLRKRDFTWENCAAGIARFACGLGKKVLLANAAGSLAKMLLEERPPDLLPAADAWFGILMYTALIYFDFSGYSDMAIGLGRVFGFTYGENFRYPYFAASVTDFWRRWHISLGSFFRDYVYIPLGGNRRRVVFSLFMTWFLTGLWHGASWNFILWGVYYFLWLAIERFALKRIIPGAKRVITALYTFPAVVIGWVLFYFTDMSRMAVFFGNLFGQNGIAGEETASLWIGRLPLLLLCAVGASPLPKAFAEWVRKNALPKAQPALTLCYNSAVLALCTVSLAAQSYNPFLYFRF